MDKYHTRYPRSEKEGWKAGPVWVQEVLQEVDGAGKALKQREGPVWDAGPVASHVHTKISKLDRPVQPLCVSCSLVEVEKSVAVSSNSVAQAKTFSK